MALLLFEDNQVDEAIKTLKTNSNRNELESLKTLSIYFLQFEKNDLATNCYQQILSKDPEAFDSLSTLGFMLYTSDKYLEAL